MKKIMNVRVSDMAKFMCHVENEETGYITDEELIKASDESEAEVKYYESHPDTGFDGDECIVTRC